MKLKNIIKVWNEELFHIEREKICEVNSDLKIKFVPITVVIYVDFLLIVT